MCGFIFGFTILFHFVYLFFCQYHTVFITAALKYNLKSGNVITLAFFFVLRIVWAIQGLLWFYTNFRISYNSENNSIGISIERVY